MMNSEENEMDLLELTFCNKNKKVNGSCPWCGETMIIIVPNGYRTYLCGYSRGHAGGDTPCKKS